MIYIEGEGRFGNFFIRIILGSIFAKKFNIMFDYTKSNIMKYIYIIYELGIPLFCSGEKTFPEKICLEDSNIMKYFRSTELNNSLIIRNYYQMIESSQLIYDYLRSTEVKNSVIENNKYKERYNTNNDIFIHARLGDIEQLSPPVSYYANTIDSISHDRIYLSTDSWDHPIVLELIEKYNIQKIDKNEIDTILFGSTCKHIIVWDGTFSYIICALGYFSNVYFYGKFTKFCGNIFNIEAENWKGYYKKDEFWN